MAILLLSNTLPDKKDPERSFFETYGSVKSVGYFASRYDPSRKYYDLIKDHYSEFEVEKYVHVDLDKEFDPIELDQALACDLIHLSGGNTPYFLNNILQRGVDQKLREYEKKGGLIVGVSAGAILLGPSLEISFDDAHEKETAKKLGLKKALGLYSFEFYPHFNSSPEQNSFLRSRFVATEIPVAACRDGDGVILKDGKIESIGPIEWIKA